MRLNDRITVIESYIVIKSYLNGLIYKALPVGAIRQRKDGNYKKIESGQWVKVKTESKSEDKKKIKNLSENQVAVENKKINNDVIKHFGTTNDIHEAGYILDDGRMLDFSGKKEGGTPGNRSYDHRDVSFAFGDDSDGGTSGMLDFMGKASAVRIDANAGVVNTIGKPNEKQIAHIVKNIKNFNDGESISLEIYDKKGNTIDSKYIENPRAKDVMDFYNKHKAAQ